MEGYSRNIPKFENSLPEYFENLFDFWKVVGVTGVRQVGSSTFSASGLKIPDDIEFQKYLPSVMSEEAAYHGLARGMLPSQCLDTELIHEMINIANYRWSPFLLNSRVLTLVEALRRLDLSKNPGHPYYFHYRTKADALIEELDHVLACIERLFLGKRIKLPATYTVKTELLSEAKVSKKRSRLFANIPLPTNVTGEMLFGDQNDRMHQALYEHPNTNGVEMPGPGFITLYTKMKAFSPNNLGWDDDASSWDILILLLLVYVIFYVRMTHLPKWAARGCHAYYSEVYCGYVSFMGHIVKMISQKSGQINTADDNAMMKYLVYYIPFKVMNPHFEVPWKAFIKCLYIFCGGDDTMGSKVSEECNWHPVAMLEILAKWGVYLEVTSYDLKPIHELVYYSHRLIRRYVRFCQMWIWVAGGRRDKMIAGLEYQQSYDAALTVSRLYALVNGLWPWEDIYERCLSLVDNWVDQHPRNKVNDELWLNAKHVRMSDEALFKQHTGLKF